MKSKPAKKIEGDVFYSVENGMQSFRRFGKKKKEKNS